MFRPFLTESQIHPAIRSRVANHHQDIVQEVQQAIESHCIVVVGMAQNPQPRKALKLLKKEGIEHLYLEYGSYFNQWRRRNALKMWTGWPTFPMIFVNGVLVGGASDLEELMLNGQLQVLLSAANVHSK
jgi:monothiol glutaredoxin